MAGKDRSMGKCRKSVVALCAALAEVGDTFLEVLSVTNAVDKTGKRQGGRK